MTISDDARNATIAGLMNGSQPDRDRFIITTLLDIKENGCAKACATGTGKGSAAVWGGGIAAIITAIAEGLRQYTAK